jgi:hypothetical protein
MPATGKSFSSPGVSLIELSGGKAKRGIDYYDGSSLMRQLGLLPPGMTADPFVGTWKMNIAKSKINSGPPDKSSTATFTAQDNGIKLVNDGADADGKAYHSEFAGKFDGKDYPFTGSPDIDTVAIKKIDANTWSEVAKKAGKEIWSGTNAISKDGKTMTHTTKGKDAKGQNYTDISVFDKQ